MDQAVASKHVDDQNVLPWMLLDVGGNFFHCVIHFLELWILKLVSNCWDVVLVGEGVDHFLEPRTVVDYSFQIAHCLLSFALVILLIHLVEFLGDELEGDYLRRLETSALLLKVERVCLHTCFLISNYFYLIITNKIPTGWAYKITQIGTLVVFVVLNHFI